MLTDLFQGLLDELNYLNVTILMAVESSAIPFPSEIVVPPAAYMAAEKGEMSIPLVIVFATLGSCIGAAINYVVSYYVGRPIVYKFVNSRLGHICLLNQEKMERAEAYFDSKPWYHGTIMPNDFKESMFNDYEKKNSEYISAYEKRKGYD